MTTEIIKHMRKLIITIFHFNLFLFLFWFFCKIVADKDGIILQHLKHSGKCSSPIPGSSKCSYRRGYCRRNQEGVCQWQVLNPC